MLRIIIIGVVRLKLIGIHIFFFCGGWQYCCSIKVSYPIQHNNYCMIFLKNNTKNINTFSSNFWERNIFYSTWKDLYILVKDTWLLIWFNKIASPTLKILTLLKICLTLKLYLWKIYWKQSYFLKKVPNFLVLEMARKKSLT
jgi:hypothetical protein